MRDRDGGTFGVVMVLILIILLFGANYIVGFDGINNKKLMLLKVDSESVISEVESDTTSSSESEDSLEAVTSEVDTRPVITLEHPYYIKVDKGAQIVTVYTTNEEGKYEKIVREMLCSTGVDVNKLPNGYYPLKDKRKRWATMFSVTDKPSYAQYTTQITGYFLFHSVTYDKMKEDTLHYNRFNSLGKKASGGCIRLTVENAKWIQENCNPGTIVEICNGPARPELVKKLQEELGVGKLTSKDKYDPTDPNGPNPITQYPNPDPKPDPYAELYDYNIKFSPECLYTRSITTTTPTTTTSPTTPTTPTTKSSTSPTTSKTPETTPSATTPTTSKQTTPTQPVAPATEN